MFRQAAIEMVASYISARREAIIYRRSGNEWLYFDFAEQRLRRHYCARNRIVDAARWLCNVSPALFHPRHYISIR